MNREQNVHSLIRDSIALVRFWIRGALATSLIFLSCYSQDDSRYVYLFSYFKGNGEDGLHLASSADGWTWNALKSDRSFLKPEIGVGKLLRDPCLILGPDQVFHMVWTIGWWEKSIGIAHSKDLIHWSEQKPLPVMEHEPDASNCWAPEIFYDTVSSRYLIFWSTAMAGRFPETEGKEDTDPDVKMKHCLYYVTTTDFVNYSATQLFYDNGFGVLDATLVRCDGKYALLMKDVTIRPEQQENIRISFADQVLGPWSSALLTMAGDYYAEGPTAIEIDHRWFVYLDNYRKHQYSVMVSDDLKNWQDCSARLSMPKGLRHGTAFRVDRSIVHNLMTAQE
jgi:hypothetical protein